MATDTLSGLSPASGSVSVGIVGMVELLACVTCWQHQSLIMKYFLVALYSAPLMALYSAQLMAQPAAFEIINEARPVARANQQVITETVWKKTEASGESVQLHRYQSIDQGALATLLYLPGTNMNGELKVTVENHNLWLYLAGRGVAVYAMDYRTHFIEPDFDGDLEFMRDWTLDLFHEDAVSAAAHVSLDQTNKPLYIAGFSRGALFAYTVAAKVEADGVVALDGYIKNHRNRPFELATALQKFDADGTYSTVLSRRGFRGRDELLRRAIDEPEAPASDPRFDSAAAELSESLYRAWGAGVLANTRAAISPIKILATELRGYDWFYPSIQMLETQSVASNADDPNTYIDDQLEEASVPVLYFGSGRSGAKQLMNGIHSASLVGGDDVSIHVLEEYGHLDVLFAGRAVEDVYQVILNWIMADLPSAED